MARNYAALPYEYLEEMEALNDAEFGRLTRALLTYSMTGEPIALCGNERFYAKRVMLQEDRFKESYEEVSSRKREAGKNGAAKRWHSKNSSAIFAMADDSKNGKTETNTETETNTNTLPSNDGKSKADKTSARFSLPSVEDVSAYCLERKNGIDAQHFVDFYAARGWMLGKDKMKDWKAAVRTWEKKAKEFGTGTGKNVMPVCNRDPNHVDPQANEDMARMRRLMAQMKEDE